MYGSRVIGFNITKYGCQMLIVSTTKYGYQTLIFSNIKYGIAISTVGHPLALHLNLACNVGHHHCKFLPQLGVLHSTDLHAHVLPAGAQLDHGRIQWGMLLCAHSRRFSCRLVLPGLRN